ncbi:hypothetical protein HMPREF9442_00410 [Paraprevotella xylaniphila YIT 11841]|uniref:Uncharacterized protein n=1 Tax=Paraprevotella xylaniphila YIT 11841 TaxID=762982 RepID=F3QQG8_9BACT|nr:hypothetical protein HMPREF9442_00410 [Paraprevotella xylaniphila YIT 11841]
MIFLYGHVFSVLSACHGNRDSFPVLEPALRGLKAGLGRGREIYLESFYGHVGCGRM